MAQSVNDSIHVNTQRTIMQHPMENDLRDSNLFFKAQKVEFYMNRAFMKNDNKGTPIEPLE